ncbi:MAG TPA: ferritin family protein [Candidatus Cloacimonetes bacterium]|mgnify:CR=1 FL=1|nr:ferritin family protein [Candidatus Cloacimonadota bacterium]
MTTAEFNEILDFAIAREEEAIAFYRDLQSKTKFTSIKEMLKELELMEMSHIVAIEGIRKKGTQLCETCEIENLKISDYMVHEPVDEELTYQNILLRAMKREEQSYKLYIEMSKRFSDPEISNLFKRLAHDEAKHKNHFEKLYDDFLSEGN